MVKSAIILYIFEYLRGGVDMNIDYTATLLRIRAELNLSQTELAEMLGVSFTSVNIQWVS